MTCMGVVKKWWLRMKMSMSLISMPRKIIRKHYKRVVRMNICYSWFAILIIPCSCPCINWCSNMLRVPAMILYFPSDWRSIMSTVRPSCWTSKWSFCLEEVEKHCTIEWPILDDWHDLLFADNDVVSIFGRLADIQCLKVAFENPAVLLGLSRKRSGDFSGIISESVARDAGRERRWFW